MNHPCASDGKQTSLAAFLGCRLARLFLAATLWAPAHLSPLAKLLFGVLISAGLAAYRAGCLEILHDGFGNADLAHKIIVNLGLGYCKLSDASLFVP